MTISSLKQGFELSDKLHTILVDPLAKEIVDSLPFIISRDKNISPTTFTISSSGDYELSDISVSAFKIIDSIDQVADLYKITIENLKVLYVREGVSSIPKDMIEELGTIHVLILELDSASIFSKKVELVQEIEPYYICVNSNNESSKIFEKELGETAEPMKKLKIKSDEFNAETDEVATKLILLG